jgi:hypothetical protein
VVWLETKWSCELTPSMMPGAAQRSSARAYDCPDLVETYQGWSPSGIYAPPTAQPTEVTIALREKGWVPYRIWFEPEEELWVAKVIDWGQAA